MLVCAWSRILAHLREADANLDYLFLAAAGHYGDTSTYNRLALHLGSTLIISNLAIPDTGWHHISVSFNPVRDIVRFTLDGQADQQTTTLTGTVNAGPLIIGMHTDATQAIDCAFDGLIDELSITDGFLSISELQPLAAISSVDTCRILSNTLNLAGSSLSLTFESNDSRLYTIQKPTSLQSGSWQDIITYIPGTTGSTETTVSNIPATSTQTRAFYRVSVAKCPLTPNQ